MASRSILTSVKKMLGIMEDDTSFDVDIIIHINSAFSTLNQIGLGPPEGFNISDKADTWGMFTQDSMAIESVKTYVYLKVRMLFDPPTTSFAQEAMTKQIAEFEWRLNVHREEVIHPWTDPQPQPLLTTE